MEPWLVMSEDGGQIMPADRIRPVPADRIRPVFEKGFDADFFSVDSFRHGFDSSVASEDERKDVNPTRVYASDEIECGLRQAGRR
jgi:hypothetical protein